MTLHVGRSVPRVEDERFLTGAGCFSDDLAPEGAVHAVIVRSPQAHARLLAVEVAAARAMPGVIAVATAADLEADGVGHANGCQVCEVEVDPDTGSITMLAHSVVHDIGRAVNPMIVEGQIHGGAVHGIAQALHDHVVHDTETGQLLTASLLDYKLPSAADLPGLRVDIRQTPSADRPPGVKGVGEGPTVCATPAVVNAVLHALAVRGVRYIDMPLTPLRVWGALREADGVGL